MTTQHTSGAYTPSSGPHTSGGSAAALSMSVGEQLGLASLVVLAILCLIGVAPFAAPGLPASQVGVLPILRLMGADLPANTLLAGDAGWIYTLASFPVDVGMAPAGALQLLSAIAIVVAAFGAYAVVGQTWGPASGLIAGTFFLFLPTQISLRFIRGVPGDVWFWAFVLWSAWGIARPERVRRLVVSIVLLLVSLLTWPAPTVLAVPPLVLLAGNGWWQGGRWRWLLGGWLLGMGIVAGIRWSDVTAGEVLQPFQLFSAAWPESTPSAWVQGGSYSLGLLAVVGALFVTFLQFDSIDAEETEGHQDERLNRPPTLPFSSASLLPLVLAVVLAVLPLISPAGHLVAAIGGTQTIVALASLLLALTAARLPLLQPAFRDLSWLVVLVGIIALRGYGLLAVPSLGVDQMPAEPPVATFRVPEQGATFLLLDATTDGPAAPGQTLEVTTRWQMLQPAPRAYTAFVHLDAPDGTLAAQADRLLLSEDERRSSRWGVGELITQTYEIPIPADAPEGPYTIRTGLYLVDTLERLPRVQGGDAVEVRP